ncbi:MAG TPA: bifunctional DNA-formamidopyrimidine glycosylase/DNA-(apurinic or apyrimidinic site) lyase [Solirubrobacteraceae bacterium]
MPELPEVETIRRHLAPHVEGRTLSALRIDDARWSRPLAPGELIAAVEGRRVERLGRRGKYLVWELEDEVFLLVHLRMTGTLLLSGEAVPHTRVRFELDGGEQRLIFVDPRRFGTGELALGADALEAFLAARLGVEPFDPAFTVAHLRALARRCRAPVKAFLLDQKRIAGVGNIYADEALHRAGIHPERRTDRLRPAQIAALRDAVVAALEAGVAAKGATIDDFRHPDGVRGSFQDQFLVHTRAGAPCPACGSAIRKLVVGGRGTYVCERCQPRPRGGNATLARSGAGGPYAASPASLPSRSARASSV